MLLNQSHFIIENILKIEKKVLISKTSTTLPIRKNGWGTRIDVVKGAICPKFLAFLVILCFERPCRKQNTVARIGSKDLPAPLLWSGYASAVGTRRDKHPKNSKQ